MKRDMELCRRILLEVESWPVDKQGDALHLAGVDHQVVSYHIMLLDEAGLLRGVNASSGGDCDWLVERLSWEGHEFVEASRDDTRWKRALSTIADRGGTLVFDILKQLLVQFAKEAVFGG